MATQRERIGFIGLGSMGRPMATSLVRKGFALSAFDTAAAHTAVLVERGAARAGDLAALVSAADVVITMLPNTPDVAGVVSGPGGLTETGRPGMLMIDMSTIDPAASRSFGAASRRAGHSFHRCRGRALPGPCRARRKPVHGRRGAGRPRARPPDPRGHGQQDHSLRAAGQRHLDEDRQQLPCHGDVPNLRGSADARRQARPVHRRPCST